MKNVTLNGEQWAKKINANQIIPKNIEKFSQRLCYYRILARLISDGKDNKKNNRPAGNSLVSQIVQTPKWNQLSMTDDR